MQQGLIYLSRVPVAYLVTAGYGDTDFGVGVEPWQTGAYDLALRMAGIEDFNMVMCTSVIPPEAYEVSLEAARPHFRHGAVMEAIMAVMHGRTGETVTAGLGRCHVYERASGVCVGGFAAEYKGHRDPTAAARGLRRELEGIMLRRYDPKRYDFTYEAPVIASHEVQNRYGTALAALCWLTYLLPEATASQVEDLRRAAIDLRRPRT